MVHHHPLIHHPVKKGRGASFFFVAITTGNDQTGVAVVKKTCLQHHIQLSSNSEILFRGYCSFKIIQRLFLSELERMTDRDSSSSEVLDRACYHVYTNKSIRCLIGNFCQQMGEAICKLVTDQSIFTFERLTLFFTALILP